MEHWAKTSINPKYEVSDFGNIRHYKRLIPLVQSVSNSGYKSVTIMVNGKNKKLRVHREVAKAFLINKNNKPQVNHIDGDKTNNKSDNLEWATCSENMKHAQSVGLKKIADKRIVNDKTVGQYDLSGKLIKEWKNTMDIRRFLGYDNSTISKAILKNRSAYGFKWKRNFKNH